MRTKQSLILFVALLGAAIFILPGSLVLSLSLTGDSLGISTTGNGYQRDFRVNNNFADGVSNNNNVADPNYPGALGAEQAIWKAAAVWNSDAPDAGKNFDFDWQGNASSSPQNANIIDATTVSPCGGSVLGFTELSSNNGYRIRYCDQWTWADGPGSISGSNVDLQGVGAHEFGHALGLGHTSVNCGFNCTTRSTMCASVCSNGVSERTIEPDDANGLEAIYGAIPANKSVIGSISGSTNIGGTLQLNGAAFSLSTVRVKFTAGTSQNTGNINGVVEVVPETKQRIKVTVPSSARTGNVLVWKHTANRLSNPFPITIGPALGAECYGQTFGLATAGALGSPTIGLNNGPSIIGNDILEIAASGFEPSTGGFMLISLNQVTLTLFSGTWLNVNFPLVGSLINVGADASGNVTFPYALPDDPLFIDLILYNQFLMFDSGGPDGFAGTEALAIQFCDPQI